MKIKLFQVDAFAGELFSGNPAAVCPLENWLPETLMQNIAAENNLSETAFFIKEKEGFHIRWFTPTAEVDLCGHATLATAHVLFNHLNYPEDSVTFQSRSGFLSVRKEKEYLTLDFPTDTYKQIAIPSFLNEAFNIKPIEAYKGVLDYMLVFKNQQEIEAIIPDLNLIAQAESRGAIITAPGYNSDFVSRYFAPQFGIPEDPVTGSAHTILTPYWSKKLGKKELSAIQLSKRKGHLTCTYLNERVDITGQAKTYLIGEIEVEYDK
nr:PhzF family phenazine biosynthesis protein [uncultured Flavobacterium sp.]